MSYNIYQYLRSLFVDLPKRKKDIDSRLNFSKVSPITYPQILTMYFTNRKLSSFQFSNKL